MAWLLLVLLLGILVGIVTGMLPGLHPNSVIFLLLPTYFAWQPPTMQFIAFATGMSVVHTFVSFIPSILVGTPESDTALSVLPGHKYVHHGRAFEAIQLTVYGGLVAAVTALLALPLLFYGIPLIYEPLTDVMHIVLAGLFLFFIRDHRPLRVTGVILLSGILGLIALNSPAANSQYILFPLFAGMFGLATMLPTLQRTGDLPPQLNNFPVQLRDTVNGGLYGFAAGVLAGFLPGFGSAQSAMLVEETTTMPLRDTMVMLGGINTADLFLSLVALYVIGNPRSGAAVAIEQVSTSVTLQIIGVVIGMVMISISAGAVLTRFLAKHTLLRMEHIPYTRLLYGVIGFVIIGSYALSSWFGLVTLATGTAIGLYATSVGVRRSYCMAALIIPTILSYADITLFSFV